MKQSKTITYPGPANEALRRAAAYMTSKHQYEITHSSDYSITFNKVRKLGALQLLDFQQTAYNETATLVANEVDGETHLNIGGSNRLARTDLQQAVEKLVKQGQEKASGGPPLAKTGLNMKEELHVYPGHIEVRTGWSYDRIDRSLQASEIASVTLEGGILTITDTSGKSFVQDRPTRAKKVYAAIQEMQPVNA